MIALKKIVTDAEIISSISRSEALGWELLQNKYATILYGAILRLVHNEAIAAATLIEVFVSLKADTGVLINSKRSLCIFLLHYVHEASVSALDMQQRVPRKEHASDKTFPFLNSLMYKRCSLNDVATENVLTQQEVQLRLRSELNQIRNRNAVMTM